MTFNVNSAIAYTWGALGLVWLIGLAFTKRTVRSQSYGTRAFPLALVLFGFALVGSHSFRRGWLGLRFLPDSPPWAVTGLALTVVGCLFAIWARLILGANWSGRATVKAAHELIVSGPYALARHPIYTGLLLAAAGTALVQGEWRCILGVALIALAFAVKIGQEERLMRLTFPQAYARYRQKVKALIPGVF
ncbi:MAG TPA: isoprenylcysteine carboxylmethyltransferase family protein [Terracidiphilus sp.]